MSLSAADISAGAPKPPSDLDLIYQGGENFLARMKAIGDERKAIEKLLAELKLGSAAKDLHVEATKKHAEAEQARTEASQLLKDAHQTVWRMTAEAKEQADLLVSQAAAKAKEFADAADKRKAEVDLYAAQAKRDADKLAKQAAKTHADADARAAELQAAIDGHQAAQAAAEAAQIAAEKAKARLDTKASRLRGVLDE